MGQWVECCTQRTWRNTTVQAQDVPSDMFANVFALQHTIPRLSKFAIQTHQNSLDQTAPYLSIGIGRPR
eukprot:4501800-Amphidinium_carterae.1